MCFIDKLLSLVDDIFAQKVFITHWFWVFLSSGIIQDSKIRTIVTVQLLICLFEQIELTENT